MRFIIANAGKIQQWCAELGAGKLVFESDIPVMSASLAEALNNIVVSQTGSADQGNPLPEYVTAARSRRSNGLVLWVMANGRLQDWLHLSQYRREMSSRFCRYRLVAMQAPLSLYR